MWQGGVLSPLLFNLLITSAAAAVRRECRGVPLGPGGDSPRVAVHLYADDLAIFAEPRQSALTALGRWADLWRFSFGVGPSKSAAMRVPPAHARARPVRLGTQDLPWVTQYPYLGFVVSARPSWGPHHVKAAMRGGLKSRQACAWADQERLHVGWCAQIFAAYVPPAYVLPAFLSGTGFVPPGHLRPWVLTHIRWGRAGGAPPLLASGCPVGRCFGRPWLAGLPSLPCKPENGHQGWKLESCLARNLSLAATSGQRESCSS